MRIIGACAGAILLLHAVVSVADERGGIGRSGSIKVESSAFDNGGKIPAQYTCEGKGVAPPLSWSAVPPATKSLAVVVEDPDAPNGTFEHFVAFNLPPDRTSLPTEAVKSIAPGSQLQSARNTSGTVGFAPICPPSGRHHYKFDVIALDTTLDLPAGSDAQAVRAAMRGHELGRGELVGVFGKR